MNCKLTEEQCSLVEQNQSFIYDYADRNNLDIDEYYGILAIGLCKAAMSFDDSKGKFSTFAYACMKNEVLMYWRSITKKSAIPYDIMVSLDDKDEEEIEKEILNRPFQNLENCGIMLDALMESLTEFQKDILELMLQEETQEKISKILGCKQQKIWYNIQQIRKKASKAFY